MLIGITVALIAIIIDQLSKALIFSFLAENGPAIAVTSFFNLVTAWNTGVSFSMFNNLGHAGVYILSAFSISVVGFLFYWLSNEKSSYMRTALGLVIGGALGNVIDRVRLGAVFDFLDFHISGKHWPAFNAADSFICIGVALLICSSLFIKNTESVSTSKKG